MRIFVIHLPIKAEKALLENLAFYRFNMEYLKKKFFPKHLYTVICSTSAETGKGETGKGEEDQM